MYIVDNMAYADEQRQPIKICGIRPIEDYVLWVRFNTGEAKLYDFKPLLKFPVFERLKDESVFKQVYIDYGIPVWCDGEIDIAPEELYNNGEPC